MQLQQPENMKPHTDKVLAGEYDIPGLELPAGSLILDIGANVGAFTLWARKRWPQCRGVKGYEMSHQTRKLYALNTGQQAERAVTADGRMIKYFTGKNNCGETSIHDLGEQNTPKGRRYDSITLSAKELPWGTFLKLDTEGCELEILQAYPHLHLVWGVALEWHRAEDVKPLAELFKAAGFTHMEATPTRPDKSRGIMKVARFDFTGTKKAEATTTQSATELALATGYAPPHDAARDCSDVFFAIPVHYQPTAAFSIALMGIRDAFPGAHVEYLVGDSHPDRARNTLVNTFLKGSWRYLFFLDADLAFKASDLRRLLDHQKEIICGFYAKKKPGPAQWVCNPKTDKPDAEGLVELWEGPTGCMLIRREVFERIIATHPQTAFVPDQGTADAPQQYAVFWSGVVFDPRVQRRRWMSEDWMFSLVSRQVGYTIYSDPTVICKHEGACFFPIQS
jgi:FkbM family methyltransferase